jgi:hypothetical protein
MQREMTRSLLALFSMTCAALVNQMGLVGGRTQIAGMTANIQSSCTTDNTKPGGRKSFVSSSLTSL